MDFFDQLFEPLVPVLGVGVVNLLIALIILIVGYIVAKIVERAVVALLQRTTLDDRLARTMESDPEAEPSIERAIGRLAFYLVMLFVLVAFFRRLGLNFITEPLNQLIADIVAFLPNLIAAAIILAAGYLLARILRGLVTQVARQLGAERLARRVGLNLSLSQLLGTLVYALVLIPTIIAALNALEIEAISQPATRMLETFLDAIPNIFGAAILLAIAYFVGRVIADIVSDLLAGFGFNDLVRRLGLTQLTSETTIRTPSDIVGTLVLVAIMLFAIMEAADLLQFELLALVVAQFLSFGARLLLALAILAIGIYLANLARDLILSSGGKNASLLATLARWAVIIFSGAIALEQLGLGEEIVNLAFGLTLGALALAAALAFGLGARDVAGREAERLVDDLRSAPPEPPRPTDTTPPGPVTPPPPPPEVP